MLRRRLQPTHKKTRGQQRNQQQVRDVKIPIGNQEAGKILDKRSHTDTRLTVLVLRDLDPTGDSPELPLAASAVLFSLLKALRIPVLIKVDI